MGAGTTVLIVMVVSIVAVFGCILFCKWYGKKQERAWDSTNRIQKLRELQERRAMLLGVQFQGIDQSKVQEDLFWIDKLERGEIDRNHPYFRMDNLQRQQNYEL